MHRGVGAPWPPAFGNAQYFGKRSRISALSKSAAKTRIGKRKRVRLTQGAHRNVVRGAFSDAGNAANPRDRLLQRHRRRERESSVKNSGSQRVDGRLATAADTRFGEVRGHK